MNRIFNQILISLKAIEKWLKRGLSVVIISLLLLSSVVYVYAANPHTTILTVRLNRGNPSSITNLVSKAGTVDGEVDINWTVPWEEPAPDYGELEPLWPYHLKYSTISLSDLGADDNAWWNQANEYPQFWSEQGDRNNDGNNGWGDEYAYKRYETLVFGPEYYGQIVYLAMRAQDSGESLSITFNISSATVKYDFAAPAAISDLTALTGSYEGEVLLQWTAPGDDGILGNLTGEFNIKYAQQIINNSNYDLIGQTITVVANNLVPLSQQQLLVSGLAPGVTYWFAIKAKDDLNNVSVWNSTSDVATVNTKAFSVSGNDVTAPASVTLAVGNVGFNDVELTWNAPTEDDGRPVNLVNGIFDIRFSSHGSIPSAVAWNSIPVYNRRSISTSTIVGAAQSYTVTGLADSTTWWFCLITGDEIPNWSNYSNSPSALTIDRTPPAVVTNFTAKPISVPVGREIHINWTNPTDSDYKGTLVVYSFDKPTTFSPERGYNYAVGVTTGDATILLTGSATYYAHSNLIPNLKYYYTAFTYDGVPNYSVATTTNAVAPPSADVTPPREPRNVRATLSADKNYLTIEWNTVTKSTDGVDANDLSHYVLHRAASVEGTAKTWTLPIGITSTTTYTGGDKYYYWITCHDLSLNSSKPSARVDTTETILNLAFFDSDSPKTCISIPGSINSILYKETNSFGDNVYFDVVNLTSEESGKIVKSFTFIPKKAKTEEVITGLLFSRALADIKISYATNGSADAPSLAGTQARDSLALFWFNGVEWVKIGGNVDINNQTVSIKTKKGGKYQLRHAARSIKFALTKVYPRIFTPNGDGWNDVTNFIYEGNDNGINGKIFDINGAFISDMSRGDTEDSLKWDGKDSSGKAVSSGIYIYQIEADGKVFNGTVVVAK